MEQNRDRTLLVQSISGWHGSTVMTDSRPCRLPSPLAEIPTPASIWRKALWPCLFRRFSTGLGGLVEVSLLESILDMQFEVITTF